MAVKEKNLNTKKGARMFLLKRKEKTDETCDDYLL